MKFFVSYLKTRLLEFYLEERLASFRKSISQQFWGELLYTADPIFRPGPSSPSLSLIYLKTKTKYLAAATREFIDRELKTNSY